MSIFVGQRVLLLPLLATLRRVVDQLLSGSVRLPLRGLEGGNICGNGETTGSVGNQEHSNAEQKRDIVNEHLRRIMPAGSLPGATRFRRK